MSDHLSLCQEGPPHPGRDVTGRVPLISPLGGQTFALVGKGREHSSGRPCGEESGTNGGGVAELGSEMLAGSGGDSAEGNITVQLRLPSGNETSLEVDSK